MVKWHLHHLQMIYHLPKSGTQKHSGLNTNFTTFWLSLELTWYNAGNCLWEVCQDPPQSHTSRFQSMNISIHLHRLHFQFWSEFKLTIRNKCWLRDAQCSASSLTLGSLTVGSWYSSSSSLSESPLCTELCEARVREASFCCQSSTECRTLQ